MNKAQKQIELAKLADEQRQLNVLKAIYRKAAEDVNKNLKITNGKIEVLLLDLDNLDEGTRSVLQSQIYHKNFQEGISRQLNGFLNDLNSKQYKSIDEYLNACYETGFVGAAYELADQGIPLIMPIDQKKVVKAVKIDSKISKPLYTKLGEDVDILKKRIANNISRGIAFSDSYENIARNIRNDSNVSFNKAMRIVRTEGHRVNIESSFDAMKEAQSKGADIVKQWNAQLDGKTRPHHRQLDGQIRELDEPFELNGIKVMYPSAFGRPEEDINCRCVIHQRAKWALDEEELEVLKERAAYYGLDKTLELKEFAKKYNIAWKEEQTVLDIRNLPEVEFNVTVNGLNTAKGSMTLSKVKEREYNITLNEREVVAWDNIPKSTQNQLRYVPKRDGKSFNIDKGSYNVQPYVKGSADELKRIEIGKSIGGEYVGTHWYSKYNKLWTIDFYKKDDQIVYSLGLADVEKKLTEKSLATIVEVIKERETLIGKKLKEKNIKFSQLKARQGDNWVDSMKEFHHIIQADGKPTIVSKAEYDAVKTPVLYRGIAPQSHLRKDITTNLTTQEMADGFFKDERPFPSRGVYGDGVAYCAPSLVDIAGNYASSYGRVTKGGKIIEFKIKEDAKVISYEDALAIFRAVSNSNETDLLFAKKQVNATDKEVGKAMNALGYDVIIKENGDNTGIPFYVILNREALIAKEDWTTLTVTPEWLKKVGIL